MTAMIAKSMKEMRMMMNKMMVQKDEHSEGPGTKRRDYKDFPSHGECSESSHHNQDLYIAPPKQHKEPKVEHPPFLGKETVDDYLDWEMKVEQLFECYQVHKERKVSLAKLSFQRAAMY